MFWLEGALESGKCYRTCRSGISVLEHTHCAFRAHQGLRGYEQTKDWWAIASAEEKETINHYLIYYLNIIKIIHNHNYWIQDLDNIKILEAARLR